MRRNAPEFLGVFKLRAAPAAKNVLDAIEVLRGMNKFRHYGHCKRLIAYDFFRFLKQPQVVLDRMQPVTYIYA